MKHRCSKQELFLVATAIAMSLLLRASKLDRLAIEHFDEGVYASSLWYDDLQDAPYPMRQLYAPPLFPEMINITATVPGLADHAPFLPSILLGVGTVIVLWWVARMWFGMVAGLFAVFVGTFSDFHILFSRMALTDVPTMFWTLLGTGLAARAISRESYSGMAIAGFFIGVAWWTKYTGWLGLAIVGSGSAFWWIVRGRQGMSALKLIQLLAAFAMVAVVTWLPWLWMLQADGGYSAVAANHRGYFQGTDGWQGRLARHILFHFRFDSWFGAASIGLGVLAAGTRRWIELRFAEPSLLAATSTAEQPADDRSFPRPLLLARFAGGAFVLAFVSLSVGAAGLMTCMAIGGMAGMFLWPVMSDLHRRRCESDVATNAGAAHAYRVADLRSAPAIDPMIGTCFTVAWFCGMVAMTPMYTPYPRLSLPLLISIWLAASGAIGWWVEANVNTSRIGLSSSSSRTSRIGRLVQGAVLGALVLGIISAGDVATPVIWQDRTSLRDAAWQIADITIQDSVGAYQQPEITIHANSQGIISPEADIDDRASEADLSAWQQLRSSIAPPVDVDQPLADISEPTCIVYAFGEPAVLSHLNSAGLLGAPVQDLNFPTAAIDGRPLPTYLILGPNALRTPGLLNDWATAQYRFQHVANTRFRPGDVTLYNLFSPEWIGQHFESNVQTLELYRLKQTPQSD